MPSPSYLHVLTLRSPLTSDLLYQGSKVQESKQADCTCTRQGFTWLEEKWHVDLSGQSAAAVDIDGWAYAVDFPWLKMPPLPGMGRKCALQHPLRSHPAAFSSR